MHTDSSACALSVLALSFVVLFGCDATEISSDCEDVCARYEACFDSDLEVDDCAENCRNESDDDESFQDSLDECAACIDADACVEDTFGCGPECAGVIGDSAREGDAG